MIELIWLLGVFLVAVIVAYMAKKGGVAYLIGFYAAILITMTALGGKLITFMGMRANTGLLLISASYLVTDMISEFYGKKYAIKTVYVGILGIIFYMGFTYLSVIWPANEAFSNQTAYALVFGATIRIALGQIVSNVIAQTHDVWAFHFLKKLTKGKHLWLRNTLSTSVSQTISTILFFTIAFYGVFDIVPIILQTLVAKVFIAGIDTPFIYFTRWLYKRF